MTAEGHSRAATAATRGVKPPLPNRVDCQLEFPDGQTQPVFRFDVVGHLRALLVHLQLALVLAHGGICLRAVFPKLGAGEHAQEVKDSILRMQFQTKAPLVPSRWRCSLANGDATVQFA